ncbi:hypothetical protein GCM10010261_50630 [Streptomyces pilosus]|uniref:Uncharacterized protein n=1 Tax=Streptomyces pilosus TaxID=28893 RepID=A0A918BXH4_9ACTN|nr:hypothetical protein GCM10010280_51510 [Streptomyces pilosus]GGV61713.1 hypothetical protein GCM10010261_50630 [Streptomyces pilosus]
MAPQATGTDRLNARESNRGGAQREAPGLKRIMPMAPHIGPDSADRPREAGPILSTIWPDPDASPGTVTRTSEVTGGLTGLWGACADAHAPHSR